MPAPTLPAKLRCGDTIRVVAPARSRPLIMEHDNTRWVDERFAALGLRLTFGDHVDEDDRFRSSSIESRVADLHAAFADPEVAGILTVIGGFNSNELLPFLDWDLIAAHPKIICGYSDITALGNAILARSNLVTYSGPHWSSFGMRDHFEPTGEWFHSALMTDDPITVTPSAAWTDDPWFADQDDRHLVPNPGWWPLSPGEATGMIVGGNLCTLNLLQGTPYLPPLDGTIVFVEDDALTNPAEFARDLTSLLQVPSAAGIAGLVIGRFQRQSGVNRDDLVEILRRQPALRGKPVVAGADFGHTGPLITVPIGGAALLRVSDADADLVITRH